MTTENIPKVVGKLAEELAEPSPMRRGSVAERVMKCGQKECRCQHDLAARHGPYLSLTRTTGGKTRSRYLTAEQAALARAQLEAGQRFRQRVEAYWRACEEWGDAQLHSPEVDRQGGTKKGGSKTPSTQKSSRKSKR
jgi:hypothetical protein